MQPEDLRYSKTHEWIRVEDDKARIGITDHAQSELGDIVFVELPSVGTVLRSGLMFGTVESVKTISDLIAPVSGEVVEVNAELPETPELINEDPYGTGWMVVTKLSEPGELDTLMSAQEYEEFIREK